MTCLSQHTEAHCPPGGSTAAEEKAPTGTERSAPKPRSAFADLLEGSSVSGGTQSVEMMFRASHGTSGNPDLQIRALKPEVDIPAQTRGHTVQSLHTQESGRQDQLFAQPPPHG